ncbi:hypothetical protein cypCar_00033678 [Cyprinus carpio]|nr:hypothetical protein cypCar_00033678 [Cyprinus carpio]
MSGSAAWRSAALRALAFGALLVLVSGGPRPEHRSTQHQREQADWTQRVQHPALNDEQRVHFPSLHDTQRVQIPSVDDAQRCSAGHYLDRSGASARCVRCSCSGFSNECEENTGRCLNCRDNRAGDHCERCKDGFYSDAAQRRCSVCPCPLSNHANNFALGCTETDGRLLCLCKDGYTGERCERCAPGYYGDPLVSGGRCRLCNCPGNLCDSKTGVCRNSLELQDTNTEEQCEECDNCAQTLLNDLEKLDIELRRIKDQLNLDTLRPSSKEHLRKLEEAITTTTNLVNTFSSTVDSQVPKVNQLGQDVTNLAEDMDNLKEEVRKQSEDSQKALSNAENSHQRAKDLDTETQNLLRKIQELLKQLMDSNSSGSALPNADLAKLLEQSENMVKEMEKRSFTTQKDAARKEQAEANKFLENVKNIIKQCDENEAASKRVDDLLSSYEAKLKELEDLLKQADNIVKRASNQNDINTEGLKDILKRVKDLERERDLVQDQIVLAVKQLKDTEDVLNMFNDSKKEYEQLAEQLNGAKTELEDKVQTISQAAAKENIVKQAEKHAENMHKLAKELQGAVQNVSGRSGVQTALSGIEAYKNITDAVNAAEEAAKKAKEAADKALNDVSEGDLINRATNLKNDGNNLLKDAKDATKDLKGATKELKNQKGRLQDAEEKKKALEKELISVQEALKGIQRDDIGNIIDAAKKAAAAANRTTSGTMNQLNDIKAEVTKISITPTLSNMDNVLNNVELAVRNVSSSIPSLLDKIEEINFQISTGNNVSDNINMIKELIEQARDAANRASGDYIGMALRNNILHVIYKLNGEEYDIEASSITESSSDVAFFDKIDLYRQIPLTISQSDYYEGTGYAKVLLERFPNFLSINQKVETRAKDALLLFLGDEEDDFFYSVSLEKGYVVLRGQNKMNILKPISSQDKASLSQKTDVKVLISAGREFKVRVGDTEVKSTDVIPQRFKHFYVGGIPNSLRQRYNITIPALKGCVKIGTAGGSTPSVVEKVGVGRGCTDELLNKDIELSMENGYVLLKFQGSVWKSTKQYQDGGWHYLTVSGQSQSVELRIDEEDVGQRVPGSSSGLYSSSVILGKDTFKGCISNLYLRRGEEYLTYQTFDMEIFGRNAVIQYYSITNSL